MTKWRYRIFALMFVVIVVNYMDRVNFAVSIPAIRHEFGFTLEEIGEISFVWGLVYALFNFPGGWIIDRLGLRWGLVAALGWWSAFTILTPFAGGYTGWLVVRGLMGAGEAPIWMINGKSARTWSPKNERSRAFTAPGSGQYLGPAFGSLVAGWILVNFGWQWTFIVFGIIGILILPVWIYVVRDRPALDPRVSQAERDLIETGEDPTDRPDWGAALRVVFSRTGIGVLINFLTFGYILFTFINWVPSYMYYTFHMSILHSAAWASFGFVFGFIGFVLSGPFNDALVRRYDRLTARRIGAAVPMIGMIICVVLSLYTARAGSVVMTALLIGLAQALMNLTVGSWAVNAIDIAPSAASTAITYGIYNGVLNLVGAANSLILTWLAARYGFPAAFGSAIVFMVIFLFGILVVVERKEYDRLTASAASPRPA